MKLYCCQYDIAWENKKANYAKVRSLLAKAEIDRGSLVLLPEMCATGFSMNVAEICESEPSETEGFMASLAREHSAFILGGLVRVGEDGRGRNETVVFGPEGRRIARYCKLHPFTLGGESDHYSAGTEIITFRWQDLTCAPFICYDLRFPEIFRAAVRQGAELFTVIANWPSKREQHWVTLLQARAIENQAYVAAVNRVGNDPKHPYPGRSLVVDPHGEIVLDLKTDESVRGVELDAEALRAWRNEFPALRDLRTEFLR